MINPRTSIQSNRTSQLPGAAPAQRAPTGAIRPVAKKSNAVASGGRVVPTGIRPTAVLGEEDRSITRSDIRHTGFREGGGGGEGNSSGGY